MKRHLLIVVLPFAELIFCFSGTSFHTDNLIHPRTLVQNDEPVVVVIGGMAHGSVSESSTVISDAL